MSVPNDTSLGGSTEQEMGPGKFTWYQASTTTKTYRRPNPVASGRTFTASMPLLNRQNANG
ncbi:hypothetical protein FRC01_013189, partial [Tulasnella sp. 417]